MKGRASVGNAARMSNAHSSGKNSGSAASGSARSAALRPAASDEVHGVKGGAGSSSGQERMQRTRQDVAAETACRAPCKMRNFIRAWC